LVGRHAHKLEVARALGIQTAILSDAPLSQGDVVVDATGSTTGLQLAIETVRPRGTLVLKSTVATDHNLSLAPLVIHEITVVGSRCGRFPPALRALAHERLSVQPLITEVYRLRDAGDAVAHAARRGVLKILLRP
jgi:threonine dehydrogenase-like Zn-dependent dehydrogenase